MRKPQPTSTFEHNGMQVEALVSPPPHVMLLGSQMQALASDPATSPISLASMAAGLGALCIVSIDGEALEIEGGKMPRDLDTLSKVGNGFLFAAYEQAGVGLEDFQGLFETLLRTYGLGLPNPT